MKMHTSPGLLKTLQYPSFILAAVLLTAGCSGIPAPTEQLAVSKAALTNAGSAGSNEFAPLPLQSAIEKMDAAERAMAIKEYLIARRLAEQAQVDAQLAAATARSVKAQNAARELQKGDSVLRQEIQRNAQ